MSTPLDFAALLSRDYKPAKLAQIQPKPGDAARRLEEHYFTKRRAATLMNIKDDDDNTKLHRNHHRRRSHGLHSHGHIQKQSRLIEQYIRSEVAIVGDDDFVNHVVGRGGEASPTTIVLVGGPMLMSDSAGSGHAASVMMEKFKHEEETNRLVMQLVSKTPTYRIHLPPSERNDDDDIDDGDNNNDKNTDSRNAKKNGKNYKLKSLSDYIPIPPQSRSIQELRHEFPPAFHNVELDDWESKIDWEGCGQEEDMVTKNYLRGKQNKPDVLSDATALTVGSSNTTGNTDVESTTTVEGSSTAAAGSTPVVSDGKTPKQTSARILIPSSSSSSITTVSPNDPMLLLEKRCNPFLENMSFENLVSWSGDPIETAAMAAATPLIFELGVAGQSIAKMALPTCRPESFADSDVYRNRLHSEQQAKNAGGGTGAIKTAADAARQGTFAEKDETRKFIEQQQKRRRELEKSKTKRVRDAMASLGVMGSGRGRAITSSLMGPGGTERTGRASRLAMGQTGPQEYIEQLDMVVNHILVNDPMSIVTLREFYRPKLPLTIVRTTLSWQFCIRHIPGRTKKGGPGNPKTGDTTNATSYQALMMGNQPGALSKAKLRTESDLTPTEGDLVLLEYSEERPPIQLGPGMASKIVTYYRGDKSKCPVSRGGGDRPVRRKRVGPDAGLDKKKVANGNATDVDKAEKPPRLVGPNLQTSITDWVGKAPKRSKDDRKNEMDNLDVLPEGVTEILHPKARGPFLGEISDGEAVTGLITNMFVAPIFQHTAESTDFLMILGRNAGASAAGRQDTLKVVLREMPTSIFTVGQTEPRSKVLAPSTQSEKVFVQNWSSYQIAKFLAAADTKRQNVTLNALHSHFNSIEKGVLRTRIKAVANYDKPNNLYTLKRLGEDGFVGVDRMGRTAPINPENVVSYHAMLSFLERLKDLGMEKIFNGQHAVSTVEMAFAYLAAQANTAKDLARKLKKHIETVKMKKGSPLQLQFYENAAAEADALSRTLNRKKIVAKFIYDELQLSPWNLTSQFIDGTHGKRDMMMLTGLGDPSGIGEGFSFLREETKSRSAGGSSAATGPKITGTDDDLRKLTMKQMGNILKTFGLKEKEIKPLKRWDRVHVIRDLSTKQAADGAGDSLERFARGEKKKTKDQQNDYKQRINVIWKRQIAALSATDGGGDQPEGSGDQPEAEKDEGEAKEVSDSDDSDDFDDFAAEFEDDLMDQKDTNAIIATQQAGGSGGDFKIRKAAEDKDLSKDARELAAFKRQQEEERVARSNFGSVQQPSFAAPNPNRKVVRQRITTTYPDGRQVTKFKFIMNTEIVGKVMNKIDTDAKSGAKSKVRPEYVAEDKQLGHAMFEEEDSFIWSSKFPGKRNEGGKRDGKRVRRTRPGVPQKKVQLGRLKTAKAQKRKREDDETEVFAAIQKRQTTSNRKERGSIRQRRPHIIFARRLEEIWSVADNRPSATPFQKPVDRRQYPSYYEIVSHPMDLSTIKKKIDGFQYSSTENMLRDFELMKNNTIKFNGNGTVLAEESEAMYNVVKNLIDQNSAELSHLEEAAAQVMGKKTTKAKGKKKKTAAKKKGGADNSDDDEDEAYSVDLNLDELSDSD